MNEKIRQKFRPFINNEGGIFVSKARKRLMGLSPGRPGWSEDSADFRHDMRTYVKNALKDIELFIEAADKKDVNRVINSESLEPVLSALLRHPVVDRAEPDLERAKIAQLFIRSGFEYLTPVSAPYDQSYEHRMIYDAIRLSRDLVNRFKAGDEDDQ